MSTPAIIKTKISIRDYAQMIAEFDRLAAKANPTLWSGYTYPGTDNAELWQRRIRACGVLLIVPYVTPLATLKTNLSTAALAL